MAEKDTNNSDTHKVHRIHLFMPALLQSIAWPLGRLAIDFFTHLTIKGRDNLKTAIEISKERGIGVIFAINHTHEMDPILSLVAIPPTSKLFPMFYVSHDRKRYEDRNSFGLRRYIYSFPAFFSSWGAHPFIAGQKDYTKSMPYHENLLRLGKSVCIFPEGKIKQKDGERKVHGGVAYLAESVNAIIVPVTISGTEDMSMMDFFRRKRRVTLFYGSPLHSHEVIDPSLPVPQRYQEAAHRILNKNKENEVE